LLIFDASIENVKPIRSKPMEKFGSVNEILDFAIEQEQNAVEFYNELSENATNDEMKAIFIQFAKEEMGHKARLTNIRETGIMEASGERVADLKISDFVVRVTPSPTMSYEEALVLAMKREKAAFKLIHQII
jgi:rubrerythrin